MTLNDFLLARVADDEETARDAAGWDASGTARAAGKWKRDVRMIYSDTGEWVIDGEYRPGESALDHIARHDPARVLAECEAKRQVVEWCFANAAGVDGEWGCCHDSEQIRNSNCTGPGKATANSLLRLLALPYADHPDFDPAWLS